MGTFCVPNPPPPKPPLEFDIPPRAKSEGGVEIGGDLTVGALGAWAGAGSGAAQASFEPHASALEKPETVLLVVDDVFVVVFGAGAVGADRLNADWRLIEGVDVFWVAGAGVGAEELERPKRSLSAPVAGAFDAVLGGLAAKLKSPKSSLGTFSGLGRCGTLFDGPDGDVGFATNFEVVSKKPPPLVDGEVSCGGATVERCLVGLLKLANGSAFCCCGWFIGGDVGLEKFKPPNASFKPPKLDWTEGDCIGGDCIPPKELWRSC